MKKHIPNGLTLLNMSCGVVAIVFGLGGNPHISGLLIFLAAFFDFFDGFFARLMKVQSKTGKELDSFADLISFGVAPSVILYALISASLESININYFLITLIPYVGFSVTLFSAVRLARFNTESRPEEFFYGLPTPANAVLIGSLPLILLQVHGPFKFITDILKSLIINPVFIITLTILLSILLVSNIRLLSLKFNSFAWPANRWRYLFLLTSLILLLLFHFAGIPLIILMYFIFSQISRK